MAANRVQWRRFAFFDKDVVSEKIDNAFDSVPTCARAEGGLLLLGDADGNISIADHNFQGLNEQRFKAFRGEVKDVAYLFDPSNHRRQFVVAVGDDSRPRIAADGTVVSSITPSYVVKIFNAADTSRPVNAFLASPGVSAVLTSFAVLPDGSQIAIGFSNRAVLLFSGSFLKDGAMMRQVSPEVILAPRAALLPVTGLHFVEISVPNKGSNMNGASRESQGVIQRRTRLFAVIDIDTAVAAAAAANSVPYMEGDGDDLMRQKYPGTFGGAAADRGPLSSSDVLNMAEGGVLLVDTSVIVTDNASGTTTVSAMPGRRPLHILDERGAGRHCTSLMADTYELLVGRAEGVFSYSMDDRGGAAGFEGDKQCICSVGRYVLVGSTDIKTRRTGVTIYDLRNKFISMYSQLPQGEKVSMVLHDGGTAYIVTSSFTLLRFREKDTQAKLDVLLRKALFPLAISLAAEEQCEAAEIVKLYRTYGDHLYKKGDFDGSVQQYCHTIGSLQPSYVVRRFLDPHRVANLVTYLEKLQDRGLATNDHAVLLLTCYVRMEWTDKVKRFVFTCNNAPRPSQYSPSTALALGRSISTAAASVAEAEVIAAWEPDDTLSAAEQREYAAAGGVVGFDADMSIDILVNGGMMLDALKLARRNYKHLRTMELLLKRATDAEGISEAMRHLTELVLSVSSADLVSIIRAHGPRLLRLQPDAITALFVRLVTGELDALRHGTSGMGGDEKASPLSSRIAVDDVIAVYVDDTAQLCMFLEALLDHRRTHHGAPLPPRAAESLLELYLEEYRLSSDHVAELLAARAPKADQSTARKSNSLLEKKVLGVLDGHLTDTYDVSHAMLLVHAAGCEAAERFLLDKVNSSELLLRKHIERGDAKGILKVLRREGRKDPELYVQVLSHFVQQALAEPEDEDAAEERWDDLNEALRLVEAEEALSPMQVVHVLSQHPQLPMSLISRFVGDALSSTCDEIASLERSVISLAHTLESLEGGDSRVHGSSVHRAASPGPGPSSAKPSPMKKSPVGVAGGRGRSVKNNTNGSDTDSRGGDSDPFSDEEDEEDNASQGSRSSVSSRDRLALEQQELVAEREKWSKIKAAAVRRASEHERFFAELEGSEDGFSTVAAAFGKTLLATTIG